MDQKIIAFEQLMSAAVDKYLAVGGKLVSRSFGCVDVGFACPLTVLMTDLSGEHEILQTGKYLLKSRTNLDYSDSDLWEFVYGYDNNFLHRSDSLFYAFGEKMRGKYPPSQR